MEYNKIISVTGLGGLFELIGSKADGAIVRSLEDKSTKFISSRSHQFSHLESIEVYTVRENASLVDVFQSMKASKENLPDYKKIEEVKAYFGVVFPEMDFERVYASDLKKMIRWYNILTQNDIEIPTTQQSDTAAEPAMAAEPAPASLVAPEKSQEKVAKKTAKQKTEASTATSSEKETAAENKPKKKAAPKKKKDEA